jgi:5-methylcytosine-specific restriction endonuclease McrA
MPSKQREQLIKRNYKNTDLVPCCFCKNPLKKEEVTIEHIIPRSLGGSTKKQNITISCHPCNHERSDLPFDFYAEWCFNKEKIKKYKQLVKENRREYWINLVFLEGRPT